MPYRHLGPIPSARGAAFTLLELLVVIVIIAIVAAITFPIMSGVKVRGQQAACASNMRQIGAALLTYANENDDQLPETTHTAGVKFERAWIYVLKPYLANLDKVRICPADPLGAQRLQANGTSYVLNSYIFVPQVGPFGEDLGSLNNVRKLPYPARTLIAFNVSDEQGASVMNDHTHSDAWAGNWRRVRGDIEPNRFRTTRSNTDHTNGFANYLHLDGHVESLSGRVLKQQIDRGIAVGQPPLTPEDLQSP
jgi:prepilin-type N-terminal cleavage/methylation domain-containing protein/prepilin-type processing-associated H-X9-DG protein